MHISPMRLGGDRGAFQLFQASQFSIKTTTVHECRSGGLTREHTPLLCADRGGDVMMRQI